MKRLIIALAALMVLYAAFAQGTARRISGHFDYIGVAADTLGTAGDPGNRIIDKKTGKIYVYDGTGWYLSKSIISSDSVTVLMRYLTAKDTVTVKPDRLPYTATSALDTLTAAIKQFKPVATTGYSQVTFVFTDSLVATSATIQFRGKVAGVAPTDWFNLDADSDSLVLLGANGTWGRTYNFLACVDSVRINVLSEAGGVAGKFWSAVKMANPFK